MARGMTPGRPIEGDRVREILLLDERLQSVEILTTPHAAAIIATRRACPPELGAKPPS